MVSQRWRPVLIGLIAVLLIWVLAIAGYSIAKNSRMTAEKFRAYGESLNLTSMSAAERARALERLAEKLNALSAEERRRARVDGLTRRLFDDMTEEEKGAFLEATMPTGFKQMITAFEQLPEEKRKRAVDDTLRHLREQQPKPANGSGGAEQGTNAPPVLSKDLEMKVRTIGLQTFYSQSSAQTKAELAPVLEELQRVMESGRPFRGR
jgi:hypothetical protein